MIIGYVCRCSIAASCHVLYFADIAENCKRSRWSYPTDAPVPRHSIPPNRTPAVAAGTLTCVGVDLRLQHPAHRAREEAGARWPSGGGATARQAASRSRRAGGAPRPVTCSACEATTATAPSARSSMRARRVLAFPGQRGRHGQVVLDEAAGFGAGQEHGLRGPPGGLAVADHREAQRPEVAALAVAAAELVGQARGPRRRAGGRSSGRRRCTGRRRPWPAPAAPARRRRCGSRRSRGRGRAGARASGGRNTGLSDTWASEVAGGLGGPAGLAPQPAQHLRQGAERDRRLVGPALGGAARDQRRQRLGGGELVRVAPEGGDGSGSKWPSGTR